MTFTGGDASARRSRASRRPAAQVPPSRIFASGIDVASASKPMPQTIGDAVEQRHRQRTPFHDKR